MQRDLERDIIPMARAEGKQGCFAVYHADHPEKIVSRPQAWPSPPGAFWRRARFEQTRRKSDDCSPERKVGLLPCPNEPRLTRRAGRGEILARDDWKRTPEQRRVCKALEKVAAEVGASNIAVGGFFA